MAVIKKRILKNQTYYYLEHSIRKGKQIQKKEVYLGRKIPSDIEKIKKKFLDDIYKEKWYNDLDRIKKNFATEQRTMPKSAREKELQSFAIKFTYDSQRIEGSTLTHRETADLLERGITPKNRPVRDVKEAEDHEELFYEILKFGKELSIHVIVDWHWKLFRLTQPDIAGKIRRHQVAISGSKFIPPSPVEINPMLAEFIKWYNKNRNIIHPVELAALTHLKFVTIHPFTDGNGRISRLVMNFVLDKNGYPMFDISYEGRNSYYNALERSQIKKDDRIFLQWLVKRYLKEFRKYLYNIQ